MAKMQTVKFQNMDAFLSFLPEDEHRIVILLRSMVFDLVPDVHESLSYNVPYYKRNKGLFFIWPGAVWWGGKRTYDGVRFGFQRGHLLDDPFDWLNKGQRKQVAWHDFESFTSNDETMLRYFILEAVLWDD